MKKLFAIFIIAMCTMPAGAAFLDGSLSPRASGQGGAFTSADDDAAAVFYNPAGIAFLESNEFGLMYNKAFAGLDQVDLSRQYFVFSHPVKSGNIGAAWTEFQANSLYKEDAFIISYGADITSLVSRNKRRSLSGGVSAKYLAHSYVTDDRTRNDPVFSGGQAKGAVTADAGLLYRMDASRDSLINFALSVRNLVPADLGLKEADVVPTETRLGFSHFMVGVPKIYSLNTALDIVHRASELNVRAGAECWLTPQFAVRLGGNADEYAAGLSADFAFNGFDVRLDYAFLLPVQVRETSGSHTLAIVLRIN